MAASTYVLNLDEQRRRILSEIIDHLGIESGSAEHSTALAFATDSLAHHHHMDAEQKKVEARVCSFAEKFLMKNKVAEATRLLLLSSCLSGKPMRVEGHRIDGDDRGIGRVKTEPSLEHPFAALSLALALSGSERWGTTTAPAGAQGGVGGGEGEEEGKEEGKEERDRDRDIRSASALADVHGTESKRRQSWGMLAEGIDAIEDDDGILAYLGGNSSQLWSSDSEREEESGADPKQGRELEIEGGRDNRSSLTSLGDTDEADTKDWLQAFEDDDSSPRTDGEEYAADGSDSEQAYCHRWGSSNGDVRTPIPPTSVPCPSSTTVAATNSVYNGPADVTLAVGAPFQRAARHGYGTLCIGADIRSLRGGVGSDRGVDGSFVGDDGEPIVSAPPFLRPCQTLEACQAQGGMTGRRRSIPEAEVVRAALHMLQGFSGTIFVRVGDSSRRPRYHDKQSEIENDGGGGKPANRAGRDSDRRNVSVSNDGSNIDPNRERVLSERRELFALSESAAGDLAVPSLSPQALAGILEDFVRIGSVAEYLRAFIADAEGSTSLQAVATSGASRSGGSRGTSSKHGQTTQAFVACVRRQVDAFDDAVAQRHRWLYRLQQGKEEQSRSGDEVKGSGETIVGVLTLLRPEVESLELTQQLVEAGAGWWIDNPSEEERARPLSSRGGRNEIRGDWESPGLRERTGRLLTVLHDALVSSAVVGTGLPRKDRRGSTGDALAPQRPGWLLRIFCEVLTPYLQLVDSWITEGRIRDAHGELFFSHLGEGGGGGGSISKADNSGPGAKRRTSDPVVYVWDTGIMIHSKALPPFLAPLAQAVALAGQDVLLVRRVGTLLSSSSLSSIISTAFGSDSSSGLSGPGLVGRQPSSSSSRVRLTRDPGGEGFSLATTFAKSLRELAIRVRRTTNTVQRAESQVVGEEESEDSDRGAGGRYKEGDPCDPPSCTTAASYQSKRFEFQQEGDGEDDDDYHGASAKGREQVCPAAVTSHRGESKGSSEASASAAVPAPVEGEEAKAKQDDSFTARNEPQCAGGSSKEGLNEVEGGDTGGVQNRHSGSGGSGGSGDSGFGDVGVGHREGGGGDGGYGGHGGDHGLTAQLKQTSTAQGSASLAFSGGDGAGSTAAAGERENEELELGFFGGTARLALVPGALFRQALHPAIAAPSLPQRPLSALPSSQPDQRAAVPVAGRRISRGTVEEMSGDSGSSALLTPRYGMVHGFFDGVDGRGGGGGGGRNEAASEDDIARALPPMMVLETCLLGPLQEHCRLASLSCLRVFENELGIVGLAGVLRDVYLSPGGSKSDTPLSRFRGVLFSLLEALPPPASLSLSRSLAGGGEGGPSFPAAGTTRPAARTTILDGVVVRDISAFLKDGSRLTALVQSSLAMSGGDQGGEGLTGKEAAGWTGSAGWLRGGGGGVAGRGGGGEEATCGWDWSRSTVVGNDRPLSEHFSVECRPDVVREWRRAGDDLATTGDGGARGGAGSGAGDADGADGAASVFPFARGGRFIDLQVFSCLKLECRLPWPISVALPPRSMEKYSRALELLLKVEFTTHVLEEAHVLHSHAQRSVPRSEGDLDRRHLQQCRLSAFTRVARAVRSYAITQAMVKPWAAFEAGVARCGSLRGFIRLHEAYLDLILQRCFLLPRSRQTLAYLLDALQAGIAFSQRYGEYITQLGASKSELPGPSSGDGNRSREGQTCTADGKFAVEEACRESLRRLDELWEDLATALGFVIPLLKEMVRSRSDVHVNALLIELDYNRFFERRESWRTERRRPR